jgi:CelD/BcsL family acetyltransferase involved in cellulose biosynthesis
MIEFADAALTFVGAIGWQRSAGAVSPCRVDVLDAERVEALCPRAWSELAAGTLEGNPWFTRQSVLAGLEAFGGRGNLRAFAAHARGDGRLVGLLPFVASGIGRFGIARPATNLYQVGGMPLVARDAAQPALASLLGHVAHGSDVPAQWVFTHVPLDGPFMTLLSATAPRLGLTVATANPYRRPVLTRSAGDFEAHAATVIGKKRRKDIERSRRRLGELGVVRFERAKEPGLVAQRVDDFLRLEQAGWKGRNGTALLCRPDHAAFARRAFAGVGDGERLCSVDSLLLDDAPIAVSVNLASGGTLFTAKCAFDERYRRFGPGMILEVEVLRHFFESGEHDGLDASTTVDGHVVAELWGETRRMGTVVLGTSAIAVRSLAAAIEAGGAAKRALKRRLGRA